MKSHWAQHQLKDFSTQLGGATIVLKASIRSKAHGKNIFDRTSVRQTWYLGVGRALKSRLVIREQTHIKESIMLLVPQ